jgi:hypothetical protein
VLIRIIHARHHNGDGAGGVPGSPDALWPIGHQDVHLAADEIRRQPSEAIEVPFRPSDLQEDALAFNIAKVAQPLPECFKAPELWFVSLTAVVQETDLRDLRAWLRLDEQRRHEEAQHQQSEERAHLHRITSSAWNRSVGGMVSPRAWAVLRLITNSNFMGCSTGSSAGLAPFRILST